MKNREAPTPALLRELLRYEPETGRLFWRRRAAHLCASALYARGWNKRFADKEAFLTFAHGYRYGGIFDRKYFAHRVIWAMVHDAWPEEVDHINGDRADNRLINLRGVSRSENCKNAKRSTDNISGVTGVSWREDRRKWRAYISAPDRFMHLGYFDDFTAAVAARCAAEIKYGYHANHGRSSPTAERRKTVWPR